MPSITIGEYRDKAAAQRDLIASHEIDLSVDVGAVRLDPATCSIRVCADAAHRWTLGKEGNVPISQRRPANVVEALDVMPGQGWYFSASPAEGVGGSGELAMLLDVFSNAEKYKKVLKEYSDREKAARAAEAGLKAARDEIAAGEAAIAKREQVVARREAELLAQQETLMAQQRTHAERVDAHANQAAQANEALSQKAANLDAREKDLKPKELTLGRREAALAKLEEKAAADAERVAALKAELEKKLALIRA